MHSASTDSNLLIVNNATNSDRLQPRLLLVITFKKKGKSHYKETVFSLFKDRQNVNKSMSK